MSYLGNLSEFPNNEYLVFRIVDKPMIRYHVVQVKKTPVVPGYRHIGYTWTQIGARVAIRRDRKMLVPAKPVFTEPAGG